MPKWFLMAAAHRAASEASLSRFDTLVFATLPMFTFALLIVLQRLHKNKSAEEQLLQFRETPFTILLLRFIVSAASLIFASWVVIFGLPLVLLLPANPPPRFSLLEVLALGSYVAVPIAIFLGRPAARGADRFVKTVEESKVPARVQVAWIVSIYGQCARRASIGVRRSNMTRVTFWRFTLTTTVYVLLCVGGLVAVLAYATSFVYPATITAGDLERGQLNPVYFVASLGGAVIVVADLLSYLKSKIQRRALGHLSLIALTTLVVVLIDQSSREPLLIFSASSRTPEWSGVLNGGGVGVFVALLFDLGQAEVAALACIISSSSIGHTQVDDHPSRPTGFSPKET